jgi:putative acetyltransferase
MSRIISYQPLYKADFKRINLEAISELFPVETHDLEQLDQPDTYILANGGAIFLAEYEGLIVGTVGIAHTGLGEYELVKLAVTRSWREIGLGRRLCEAAIEFVRRNGGRRIWLEANTALTAAIHIYEGLGFEHIPLAPSLYNRADVRMELRLNEAGRWMPQGLQAGWSVSRKF